MTAVAVAPAALEEVAVAVEIVATIAAKATTAAISATTSGEIAANRIAGVVTAATSIANPVLKSLLQRALSVVSCRWKRDSTIFPKKSKAVAGPTPSLTWPAL
ncbi:hypothetical protein GCM10007100_21980 [Roseibacillus persicicus]|uniref:Uncharacterized protein n=1 Tax=Roseibacillus persicicus TaxID=454148 RepID=A0A918WIN2_9BACT|nr:hypothetical protein GCM10007100_21980 [Roseibacillus persicicus]